MTALAEATRGVVRRDRTWRRWLAEGGSGSGLPILLLVVLLLLVVAPVVMVGITTVREGGGGSAVLTVLSSTRIIANTLYVSASSTIVAVAIGAALAFVLARTNVPGRGLLERLVVVPLYVTGLLTAIGWSWLGSPRAGLINILARNLFGATEPIVNLQSPGGVVFVVAMNAVPLPFLLIAGALRSMDPSLEESARIQGATLAGAWGRITLPLILPAILAGAILAFTLSFDEIIVTLFLKGRDSTLPLVIWGRLRRGLSPVVNSAATVIILVSFLGVLLSTVLVRRSDGQA